MEIKADPFVKWAWSKWGTVGGLLVAAAICVVFALATFNSWAERLWIGGVSLFVLIALWANARWDLWRFWERNDLRFVIAIYCDDPNAEAEIEEDFTKELRALIKQGNLGQNLKVVQATRGECKQLENNADYVRLLRRKRAHVLVSGRIRKRVEGASESYFVNLKACVLHAEVEEKQKKNFAREMTSVFPSALMKIPRDDQLPQFKITADWVGASMRYILSLAAGVSGDLEYAERMLEDAVGLVPKLTDDVVKRTKFKERLLARLGELHRAQALRSYFQWRQTREEIHARKLKRHLEEVLKYSPKDASVRQMLATTNFILTADAVAAEKDLRAAVFNDPAVFASLAFACAMQGKYELARNAYRDAWKKNPSQDLVDQVRTFIDWFKSAYPDFYVQTLWCEAIVIKMVEGATPEFVRIAKHLIGRDDLQVGEKQRLQNELDEIERPDRNKPI